MSEYQRVATPRQNQKRPPIRLIRRIVCTCFFMAADGSEVGSPAGPHPSPVQNEESSPTSSQNREQQSASGHEKRRQVVHEMDHTTFRNETGAPDDWIIRCYRLAPSAREWYESGHRAGVVFRLLMEIVP